jgi:hypothetical protein
VSPGTVAPSNWRISVHHLSPSVAGVTMRGTSDGQRLELTTTGPTVEVLGYEGEPYLRVRPDGVFENRRSPAAYVNRSGMGGRRNAVPADADAGAAPEWRKTSGGSTARWHDHRAHWMGTVLPPGALDEPSREHVVIDRWEIPLLVDGRRVDAVGDVRWLPPPSPLPMVALATGLAALLAVPSRFGERRRLTLLVGGATVAVGAAAHIWGWWSDSSGPGTERLITAGPILTALAFVVAGLVRAARDTDDAPLLLGGGGAALAVLVGWTNRGFLSSASLPTGLPSLPARAAVAVCLGAGAGLALVAIAALIPSVREFKEPANL